MTDAQLSRDITRPNALLRQLDNLVTNVIGQRSAVDEHAAQLIDAAVACVFVQSVFSLFICVCFVIVSALTN